MPRETIKGVASSPGVAVGPAFVVPAAGAGPAAPAGPSGREETETALTRLREALAVSARQIEATVRGLRETPGQAEAADILAAQVLMLEDPALVGAMEEAVRRGRRAADAAREATEAYARALEGLEDPYIRERAADVRDVGARVVRNLTGGGEVSLHLERPSIVLAEDLTPSETATLPAGLVLAFATEKGSATSHTAILAKARGIPAVTGATGVTRAAKPGETVAVDGTVGTVELSPGPDRLAELRGRVEAAEAEAARLAAGRFSPAVTRDGVSIEVAANIGSPEDVPVALANGADGSGLFRTEFLFMRGQRPPDEEEQREAYARVLAGFGGRPVVIRTLDVGGDKDIPYLELPREPNPFLGLRGLRLSLAHPELLRTQLRAIFRASAHGRARVMFPMVATLDEVRRAKEFVREVREELAREGQALGADLEVGIMIETPAAALAARSLAAEVDFVSLGTNDLTQYTLAADRTNPATARLCDSLHPAVLRLIVEVAEAASSRGIWAGVCGELAGEPLATPVLVGAGVTELSVSPPAVPLIKDRVRNLDRSAAREVARHATELATADEVRAYLKRVTLTAPGSPSKVS